MKTCAKFGAFIRRVTIRTKYRPKRPDYRESSCGQVRRIMASNVLDAVVKLKEKDVPRATFMYSAIEKHSACVLQLRRWLECRGIKRSGTKSLLLERYVCYKPVRSSAMRLRVTPLVVPGRRSWDPKTRKRLQTTYGVLLLLSF